MATVNKFVCYGDIEPKKVEWLYYPYIPKGKITIICGDPGIGKFITRTFPKVRSLLSVVIRVSEKQPLFCPSLHCLQPERSCHFRSSHMMR